MNNTNKFIYTAQKGNMTIARNEIINLSKNANFDKKISNDVELVKLQESFLDFYNKIRPDNFIFARHLMPVNYVFDLNVSTLVNDILKMVSDFSEVLDKNESISVQTRVFSDKSLNIKSFEINESVSNALVKDGFSLNITNPKQIVSFLIDNDNIYIGVSSNNNNLSNWAGGNIRFLKDEKNISRAEFKLLEGLEVFNLKLSKGMKALDLGASPGGWSKILLEKNCLVTAVDPAELDSSLLRNSNIEYKKMTAQNFFRENKETFDIITNDMKMDFNDSIDIMIASKEFLNKDGFCILTLKLGEKQQQKNAYKGISILKKHFEIIGARQLFHNRSEITVAFSR